MAILGREYKGIIHLRAVVTAVSYLKVLVRYMGMRNSSHIALLFVQRSVAAAWKEDGSQNGISCAAGCLPGMAWPRCGLNFWAGQDIVVREVCFLKNIKVVESFNGIVCNKDVAQPVTMLYWNYPHVHVLFIINNIPTKKPTINSMRLDVHYFSDSRSLRDHPYFALIINNKDELPVAVVKVEVL